MATTHDDGYVIGGVNMLLLARRQRWMLWLILASLLSVMLSIPVMRMGAMGGPVFLGTFAVGMIAIQISVLLGTLALLVSMRTNIFLIAIATVCMFIPLVSLLVLFLVNGRATQRLRKAGLKVGFMGVDDKQVVQKLGRDLCRKCRYNLTGNVSGMCPECGTPIRAQPMAMAIQNPKSRNEA